MDKHIQTHIHARTHTKRNRSFYDTDRLCLMIPGKPQEECQTTNPFQPLHHPLKRNRVQQDYFFVNSLDTHHPFTNRVRSHLNQFSCCFMVVNYSYYSLYEMNKPSEISTS
jgi:hypothetical protein